MPQPDLVVRGQRVVTPGAVRAAAIHIRGGRISAVRAFEDVPAGCEVLEAGERVVLPGLVDSHVHVNEPGRTRWEGFRTATRAAARGGTTTIVDMPLNSVPPTTTLDGLKQKTEAAAGQCHVDVAFWGGVVPGNLQQLAPMHAARKEGLLITAETCPHYLAFAAEEIADGATEFKCCPPVRERENRERLWGALRDGVIDMVVSDHSPCPPELKERETGDFMKAWGGISSLQL